MISLIKHMILAALNGVINARSHIPGFMHIRPWSLCCSLDMSKDCQLIRYEPGYAFIREKKLDINSPIWEREEFDVCEKTRAKIQSNIDKFKVLYNTDISFVGLNAEGVWDIKYPDTDACFIFSRDLSRMLCIVLDKWVYPITTKFVSLNGKPDQELIIGWDLSILRAREENGRQILEMDVIEPISMNLLCRKDVELVMIDSSIFYLQLSRCSVKVETFKKYMEPISRCSISEQKESVGYLGRSLMVVCYLIGMLFLYSIFKTITVDPVQNT